MESHLADVLLLGGPEPTWRSWVVIGSFLLPLSWGEQFPAKMFSCCSYNYVTSFHFFLVCKRSIQKESKVLWLVSTRRGSACCQGGQMRRRQACRMGKWGSHGEMSAAIKVPQLSLCFLPHGACTTLLLSVKCTDKTQLSKSQRGKCGLRQSWQLSSYHFNTASSSSTQHMRALKPEQL